MPINWPEILRILRPPTSTRNNPALGIMPEIVQTRRRDAWWYCSPKLGTSA